MFLPRFTSPPRDPIRDPPTIQDGEGIHQMRPGITIIDEIIQDLEDLAEVFIVPLELAAIGESEDERG